MATQSAQTSCGSSIKQLGPHVRHLHGGFLAFIVFVAHLELLKFRTASSATCSCSSRSRSTPSSASPRAPRRSPSTTSPAGACRPSTTAWRRAPTGCRRPPSSAWPARCSCRLRRHRLGARLDRRLRAGVDPGRAVPAQVRRLHGARLPGVPVRRQLRPLPRRDRAGVLLLHLRDGADLRHRPHRLALPRHAVRGRGVRRPRRHPALRDAGRHAGGDVDADRTVHRADHRLPHADRHPVHAAATAFPIPELTYGQAIADITAREQEIAAGRARGACTQTCGQALKPHIQPFINYTPLNFFGIIFCMMVGTASLPHILMRYFTTPSVREARQSVALVAALHLPALLLGAGLCGVLEAGGLHQHHRQGLGVHPALAVHLG